MKFTVLAAGIDGGRQIAQQTFVEFAACEIPWQCLRIDTTEHSPKTEVEKFVGDVELTFTLKDE